MLNTQLSNTTVNAQASVFAALCDDGFLRLYDGIQPTTAEEAITTQRLGVIIKFGTPAFSEPVNGLITSNPMTAGIAIKSIEPTWARVFKSDGATVVGDFSAGDVDANAIIGAFTIGTTVNCTSFSHQVLNSYVGL